MHIVGGAVWDATWRVVIYGYVKYSIKIGGKVDITEIFSYNQMWAEEKRCLAK